MEEEIRQILLAAGLKEVEKWGSHIGFAVQVWGGRGAVVWPMIGLNYEGHRASNTVLEMHTELYHMALLFHPEYKVTYCPAPRKDDYSVSSITVFRK
jgi:hypothetical protein